MLIENDLRPVEWEHRTPTAEESWVTYWRAGGASYYASAVRSAPGMRVYAVMETTEPAFKQELHACFSTLNQAQKAAERWLAGAAALAQGVCGEV